MPNHASTQRIIVLFILSLSLLLAGCGGGGSDNSSIQGENNASAVSIEASVYEGLAPLTVTFSVEADDLILSASWDLVTV